ncbi:MAG: nucleoside monophosphate kinase [Patescibacteria group bacterium]
MIVVAGSPGAGKTTQCKLLSEQLGYIWISAGDLLRKYADDEHREVMLEGELVEDAYVDSLVEQELSKYPDSEHLILLDGFPRDFHEARWLLEEYGASISHYIFIEIDQKTVIQRLMARGRKDDTEDAIEERLKVFKEETDAIIEYFSEHGVPVIRVDGSDTIENVQSSVREALHIG